MGYNRINHLIKKYDKQYVLGERLSSHTNTLNKQNQRKANNHIICDELIMECKFFHFSNVEKDFIHYLVDRFSGDFKKLHGKAKKEAIILTFIFYVKKLEDSRIMLNNYAIFKKYGLTEDIFMLVVCRICDSFIKSSPISFQDTTRYDHELLSKNGGQL